MKAFIRLTLFATVLALALVAGCDAPSPSAPEAPEPSHGLLGGITNTLTGTVEETSDDLLGTVDDVAALLTVQTIRRTEPVATGTCDVETVGWWGGTLECEEAGLRVEIPRGALYRSTEISIEIPDGDLVGYEFAPHGLEFRKKVRLRQQVAGTELEENPELLQELVAAYVDEVNLLAEVLELLDVRPSGGEHEEVFFDIEHFSGYVCATN